MKGNVSKTHVKRESWGLIPDQIQKIKTIINNIAGYFSDNISSQLAARYSARQPENLYAGL